MVSFEEFQKIDIRIAEIIEAEKVEGSRKLLKLKINLGSQVQSDSDSAERQIIAGIGLRYEPRDLTGKKIAVIVNLEPRKIFGLESQGMLLAAGGQEDLAVLVPDKDVSAGAKIS